MNSDRPTDLMPLRQAADVLGVNRATVYRWVHRGQLRSWRLAGHRYLVSRADLEQMLVPVPERTHDVTARAHGKRARELRDKHTQEVLARFGVG